MRLMLNRGKEYIAERRNVPIEELTSLKDDPLKVLGIGDGWLVANNSRKKFHILFSRDKKESPEFYSYKSLRCDGTYVFFYELVDEMRNDYGSSIHYNNVTQSTVLDDFLHDDNAIMVVHYYYGDLIIRTSECEGTPEKPWMRDRFELFWPMRTEFEVEELGL